MYRHTYFQQITCETRKSEQQCEVAKFLPPAEKQNEIKQVRDLDDFNKDALRRKMCKMYYISHGGKLGRWKRVLVLKEVLVLYTGY